MAKTIKFLIQNSLSLNDMLPGASVRNSAHGKGHEEGGFGIHKGGSSLRKPPVPEHLPPKPESTYFTVSCSHLYLWLYGGLTPITSLREGVNLQLQVNKNYWVWQGCLRSNLSAGRLACVTGLSILLPLAHDCLLPLNHKQHREFRVFWKS